MTDSAFKETNQRQSEMLANRAKKRFKHLKKRFARQNIEIFRIYDWDIPEIRAVVDWYAGHLVVGEYARRQSTPGWLPAMGEAVAKALDVPMDRLHLKERHAGKKDGSRYKRIDHTDQKIVMAERDLRFYINPYDYVDTGLFSDHRNTRQMVREMAAGRDFLNLFCYTGSFTCYAAKGGARTTLSVDRAKTAIAWTRENLALNHIPEKEHKLIQSHIFDFLDRAKKKEKRYDLAVIDPPSYSTSRDGAHDFDIAKDHPALLAATVALMRNGATLFFSTNHQGFVPDMDRLNVAEIEEITSLTIPEDYVSKRRTIHRCWRIVV
ncbi:MAG: class I SAM-dependent methyltransferase [Thermodesulfobacteriota bacterium]|nr:class I SAM-dependent methyltransferase [Thermodesulfobacteriota bacterium]